MLPSCAVARDCTHSSRHALNRAAQNQVTRGRVDLRGVNKESPPAG